MKRTAIIIFVFGNLFLLFGMMLTVISNNEIKKMSNDIKLVSINVNNKTIDKISLNDFENDQYIISQNEHNEVLKYLQKVIEVSTNIINLEYDNSLINLLSSDNYNRNLDDKISLLNHKVTEIEKISESFNDILNYKIQLDDENINNKLKSININDYKNIINNSFGLIEKYKTLINYLKSSNDYKLENNNLVFSNKKSFDEYQNILAGFKEYNVNIIPSRIVNDNVPPIIEANNITIYEGGTLDYKKHTKCYDAVDGNLECVINGYVNKNNKGSYPITVTAKDEAGNTTSKKINVNVIERTKMRYYTEIIRNQNTVIVYELDDEGNYSKIVRVFLCSTGIGNRTPTGVFYSRKGNVWGSLLGGVYGQYYTVITGSILFHSVPYYTKNKGNLKYREYNKLGSAASAGCVRVSVIDAKWLYDNCPSGMKIKIYDGELPSGVEKPKAIKIDENSPNKGWDPTDPDPNNPWNKN